jgi:hypothetical protein
MYLHHCLLPVPVRCELLPKNPSYKVTAREVQRRAAMWRFSSPTASAEIAIVERCACPSHAWRLTWNPPASPENPFRDICVCFLNPTAFFEQRMAGFRVAVRGG